MANPRNVQSVVRMHLFRPGNGVRLGGCCVQRGARMSGFDSEASAMLVDEKTAHVVSPHPCKALEGRENLGNEKMELIESVRSTGSRTARSVNNGNNRPSRCFHRGIGASELISPYHAPAPCCVRQPYLAESI